MSKIFKVQPSAFTDQLTAEGHQLTRLPYPFYVDYTGIIGRQDVWKGDPYRVVGFAADLAVQQVDLWWAHAVKDPQQAVGMYLVTANKRGDFATHQTAVASVEPVTGDGQGR